MTIAEAARVRKQELRKLKLASRSLDAKQEVLEREVNRLINRKRAVPELADLQRLILMARETDTALGNMVSLINSMSKSWSSI